MTRAAPPGGRSSRAAHRRREDLAAAVVVAYLGAVPALFARHTVDAFEQVKLWALLTAALALAALAPRLLSPLEGAPRRIRLASAVALAYLVAAGLATAFSTSVVTSLVGADESHSGLASVAAVVALFLAGQRLGLARDRRAAFLVAAVTGSAAATAYAGVQALGVDPLPWKRLAGFGGWSRPCGPMGHPNHLGGLLAMVLPLQVWLVHAALARRRRLAGVVAGIGAILSAALLVGTLSRGAWGAAGAGLAVSLSLSLSGRRRRWLLAAGAACLVLALGGLALHPTAGAGSFGGALPERVRGLLEAGPRRDIWRAAGNAFLESPILGSGLDTFALAFQRHRPPLYWTREYDATPSKAHNEPLHALATQGVVGCAAWCLVVAGAMALGLRAVRRTKGLERGLSAALLGGCVAFVVQAQVSFAVVATSSVLAVWAAVLSGRSREADRANAIAGIDASAPLAGAGSVGWRSGAGVAALAATSAFAAGWLSDPASLDSRFGGGVAVLAVVGVVAASQSWAAARVLGGFSEAGSGDRLPLVASSAAGSAAGTAAKTRSAAWIVAILVAWVWLVLRPYAASVAARSADTAAPQDAVTLLARAHRFEPLRVAYLRRLGLAMLGVDPPSSQERTAWLERSRETLARAARLVPADAYGWANLAVPEARLAAAGRLDPDQPFRSLDEALRLDPVNVTFRLAAANTALELRDLERARRYAAEAAGMLPDFAPARAQLAHVAAREGDLDEAIRLLREAQGLEWYGLTEARHVAQANLASLLIRARLFAEAEQVARALVGEAPSFAPGRYQLARTLEASGSSADATREYEATLRLDPSHRGALTALRRAGRGPASAHSIP